MNTLLKAVVFSVVCFFTWVATTALIAQQPAKRMIGVKSASKADTSPTSVSSNLVKSKFDPKLTRPPIKLGVSGALAEAHLRSSNISVEDGMAIVAAHVSIADKRPGVSYVWRLRVVDPNQNPMAGQLYDQQMFTVGANGQREVDFADTVQVPPGARRVELVLYQKAPNSDLSFLDNDETAQGQETIRIVKLLTK